MEPGNPSEFITILCAGLLHKAGGQVSLTIHELAKMQQEFCGIRKAMDTEHGVITLTLRSFAIENDRPTPEIRML
jgi:hypothetical protein